MENNSRLRKGLLLEVPRGKPDWSQDRVCIPSAGSGEVARYASLKGHEVYIADLNCARGTPSQGVQKAHDLFYERTSQKTPDFYMLTGMTAKADNMARLVRYLKNRNPKIPIIAGGTHVSGILAGREMAKQERVYDEGVNYALDQLKNAGVDFLYSGEAINISILLGALGEGGLEQDLRKIKGVSFVSNNRWFHNERHLDSTLELPGSLALREGPLWDNYLFGFEKTHLWRQGPAFPFRISKGCNNNCSFCSAMAVNPREGFKGHIPYTPLDMENSLSEFKKLIEMDAGFVFFTDENPLQTLKDGSSPGIEFLKQAKERGLLTDVTLGMMTSSKSTANEETVDVLYNSRVMMAMVGYERLNDPRIIGKTGDTSINTALKSIKNLRDAGIINMDGVIVGCFDDDIDSIGKELDLRAELGLGKSLVQPLQPYFGCKDRITAIEENLIRNDGREDNGFGGFGGMHGYLIGALATRKGLEPLDVTEAIVSAKKRNSKKNLKNILAGPYLNQIPLHFIERAVKGVPGFVKKSFSPRLSDRELAEKLVLEAIEYNRVEFE